MLKSQGYRARSAICDTEAAQTTVVTGFIVVFKPYSVWFFLLAFLFHSFLPSFLPPQNINLQYP